MGSCFHALLKKEGIEHPNQICDSQDMASLMISTQNWPKDCVMFAKGLSFT